MTHVYKKLERPRQAYNEEVKDEKIFGLNRGNFKGGKLEGLNLKRQ